MGISTQDRLSSSVLKQPMDYLEMLALQSRSSVHFSPPGCFGRSIYYFGCGNWA